MNPLEEEEESITEDDNIVDAAAYDITATSSSGSSPTDNISSINAEEVVESSTKNDDENMDDDIPTTTMDSIIIYRDISTHQLSTIPVRTLMKLGYDITTDIPYLKSDVISLILEDQIRKPLRGIPPRWKVDDNDDGKNNDDDNNRIRIVSSIEESQREIRRLMMKTMQQQQQQQQVKGEEGTSIVADEEVVISDMTYDANDKEEDEVSSNDFISETSATAITVDSIIIYRDVVNGNQISTLPIRSLLELGYDIEMDIPALRMDATSLIIEDQIRKPRNGVPPHWKSSTENVRIVASTEESKSVIRKLIMEEEEEEERKQQQQNKRENREIEFDVDDDNYDDILGTSSSRTRRERQKQQRRGDPPTPDNPLWVDMNTFRDLLKTENEMRIRILGDNFKDVVKMEGKWRLDLYRKWLWSMKDGDTIFSPPRTETGEESPRFRRRREVAERTFNWDTYNVDDDDKKPYDKNEWRKPIMDPTNISGRSTNYKSIKRRGRRDWEE